MISHDRAVELDRLGSAQYGLVTSRQLSMLLSKSQRSRWVRQGLLLPMGPAVFRLAGAPTSWRQRAMAACLGYGPPVALSHGAAARLWELDGIASRGIEVSVPRARRGARPAVITHNVRRPLDPIHARFEIPVTSPARTVIDLAAVVQPGALERALDDALRRRLLTPDDLAQELAVIRGSGVHGISILRHLAAQRLERPGVAESPWEDEVLGWIDDDGLPLPVRQLLVVVAGVPRRLDLAYPEWKIAIEFQSWQYHGQRSRLDRDSERTTELALAGWLVILVTSAHGRTHVLDRLRRAIALRQQEGLAS